MDASRNRFAFTGHIYDSETGLYNAKARYFDPKLGRFLTQDSYLGEIDEPPSLHRYTYGHNRPTFFVDPNGNVVRQILDQSQDQVANEGGGWWLTFAKVAVQEGAYQALDQVSFGALSRQDKLVDQNLAGEITDEQYYGRTGANVAISSAEAALTFGTAGAGGPASTGVRAVLKGAAGGLLGQAGADAAEIVGTQTKTVEDLNATDYLFNAALSTVAGGVEYRARTPRVSPSRSGGGNDALTISESRDSTKIAAQPAQRSRHTDFENFGGETLDDSLRMVEQPLAAPSRPAQQLELFPDARIRHNRVVPDRHNANVTIRDPDGAIVSRRREVSGNMTAEEEALGFPQNTLATHTEVRAVKSPLEPGQSMTITGQSPPCPSCKGKMNQAARRSGAAVKYQWREGGRTRRWRTNEGGHD